MPTSYDEMWDKLNLDLTAHEGLLQVLGKFYGDIYLTQEGRLKGMEYLDFVLSEVHGLRIKEIQEARAQGRKVIGTFCVFVPEELVLAADAVVEMEVHTDHQAMLSVDGQVEFGLQNGDAVTVRRSSRVARFLRVYPASSFYRGLEQRLNARSWRSN